MKEHRTVQVVAWGILILLVAIPLFILLAVRQASSGWTLWSVVSIWVMLDSRNIANAAFPERAQRRRQSTPIIFLGLINLVLSLLAVLLPASALGGR